MRTKPALLPLRKRLRNLPVEFEGRVGEGMVLEMLSHFFGICFGHLVESVFALVISRRPRRALEPLSRQHHFEVSAG